MHASSEPAVVTTQPVPGTWVDRCVPVFAVLAVLLLAAGLGLGWIEQANTDLPPAASMGREFAGAAAAVERVTWDVRQPDAGARAWAQAWIACNGQYDARMLATAALALQLVALGALLLAMSRRLPAGGFFVFVLLAVAMLAARSGAGPRPTNEAVSSVLLIALSLGHVALMTARPQVARRIVPGSLLGLAGIAAAPEGVAAPIAVAAWHGLMLAAEPASWPIRRRALLASGVVALGGIVLVFATGSAEVPVGSFFTLVGAAFAWPWRSPLWALVVWAPSIFCLIRVIGGDARRAPVAPIALFAIALTPIAAVRCAGSGAAAEVIAGFGLLANAACVVRWWITSRRSAESRLVLGSIWVFTVFIGLMHGGAPRSPVPVGTAQRDPATLALRESVLRGEAHAGIDFSDPRLRAILPPSIRAPLALGAGSDAAWAGRAPEVIGRDGLPVVGTWRPDDASVTGEFFSAWMATTLPLLEVRFCGTLQPPATAIVLRTRSGEEIAPWTASGSATDRWKRVNFAAPAEKFQLVVRDASATSWIAVTAPVELGRIAWIARKLGGAAPWLIALGAVCALASLAGASRLAARIHAAWVARGAPMFPWHFVPRLALVGVAAYFALNLDTTAGPNDSGGYLNSAKLLAHGKIAAEPRTIFGADGLDRDPQLHLPITFRVAPDGRIAPEYPVGLPLIIAAFAQVLPQDAAVAATILLHLLLGIVFTRALARTAGLSEGWSWLAAAIVGLSPVFVFQGLQPMSDVPALVWTTAAVYWAWRSRAQPRFAVLAGLATALAVMVRPSNLLCFAPVLLCLIGHWRQLAWWALAGLPGAAWLAWYQATLYGSPFATGYGEAGSMFGLKFLAPTLRSYARWLPEFLTPLVCLAVAGPFVRGVAGRLRAVLAVWAVVFVGLYAVYWCTWDTWFNMRFVLPAAPAMVVLALVALREFAARLRLELFSSASFARGLLPTVLLVVLVLGALLGSAWSRRVLFWVHANREHAVAAQWARDRLPADAVVFAKHASGSLAYYSDLTLVRLDREEARRPELLAAIAGTGRPIFAVTYHWETRGFVWHGGDLGTGYPDLPGNWVRLEALWDNHVFVWSWLPGPPEGPLPGREDLVAVDPAVR